MSTSARLSTRPLPAGWEAVDEPLWGGSIRSDGTPTLRLAVDYRAGRLSSPDRLTFCMLNPSGATHEASDATITRVLGFASREGFGRARVVNRWPYRATSPADLVTAIEAGEDVGEDQPWDTLIPAHGPVVIGWGKPSNGLLRRRLLEGMPALLARWEPLHLRLFALSLTPDGWPRHPLMLPRTCQTRPVRWSHEDDQFEWSW